MEFLSSIFLSGVFFAALCGYILGSLPFAVIICGKQVGSLGSKNLGATNVARNFGKKKAAIVFLLDALKGFLPVYIFGIINNETMLTTFTATIIGHVFPILYLREGLGGKGVATFIGCMTAINPLCGPVMILTYLLVYILTRHGFFGSLAAVVSGTMYFSFATSMDTKFIIWVWCIALAIFVTHRKNLKDYFFKEKELATNKENGNEATA